MNVNSSNLSDFNQWSLPLKDDRLTAVDYDQKRGIRDTHYCTFTNYTVVFKQLIRQSVRSALDEPLTRVRSQTLAFQALGKSLVHHYAKTIKFEFLLIFGLYGTISIFEFEGWNFVWVESCEI